MEQCNQCDCWLHGSRLGVSAKEVSTMDQFICPTCMWGVGAGGGGNYEETLVSCSYDKDKDIASSIGDGDRITLEYNVSPAGRPASLRGLKPTKSQVHRGFQGQSPPPFPPDQSASQ